MFEKVLKKTLAVLMILALGLASVMPGAMPAVKAAEGQYTVTLQSAAHGTLKFSDREGSQASFAPGDKVSLKLEAEKDYRASGLSMVYVDTGEEIYSQHNGDDIYTFTMPAASLSITASFTGLSDAIAEPDDVVDSTITFEVKGDGKVTLTDQREREKEITKADGAYDIHATTDTFIHMKVETEMSGTTMITVEDKKGNTLEDMTLSDLEVIERDISATGIDKKVTITFDDDHVSSFTPPVVQNTGQENLPEVGDVYTGTCVVARVDETHSRGPVVGVALNYMSGILADVGTVYAHCADHGAAAPQLGAAYDYTFTVTSINKDTGEVAGNFYAKAQYMSATDASMRRPSGKGYQRLSASVSIHKDYGGYLQIEKKSSNEDITNDNPCYDLGGAQYGVYTDPNCETGQVTTLTTDSEGKTPPTVKLNVGTYYVKELVAPRGYALDTKIYPISVGGGTVSILRVSDKPTNDPAAIEINKIDKETGTIYTQGAAKTLAGTQFTIKYYAGFYTESSLPEEPTKTWIIETQEFQYEDGSIHYLASLMNDACKVGGDDYYLQDGRVVLPLGTITVEETQPAPGYTTDGGYLQSKDTENAEKVSKYVAQVQQNGDGANLVGGNIYEDGNQVIRGDFEFRKRDEETQALMANIPFKITSNTTKESHTFMTDENGYYSSAADFNKHSEDTNGGKATSGLWFGLNGDGENVEPNDAVGALPYDTYTIEEQKCAANAGKALYKGTLTISRHGFNLDLGDIENADLTIQTTALDEASGTHYAQAGKEVTIVDTVSYTGLVRGQEYTVKGTLMNRAINSAILDANGNPVTSERKFTPKTAEGTVDVEFTFDASALAGDDAVVFEELYLGTELKAEHKDLNDEDQTVHFPELHTTARDGIDGEPHNVIKKDSEIHLVDTVQYENLTAGKTYDVKGTLMDKETGKPVKDANGDIVTAETSFKAERSTGTVDVEFVFDGSNLGGSTIVVFEEVSRGGKTFAVHADINDRSQTVTIPDIHTTLEDSETEDHDSFADEDVTLVDTVEYENLTPGTQYVVKGKLMDKDTGEALLDKDGKEIVAETEFIPEEPDGSVEVVFTFDGSLLQGKTTVAFEDLYQGEKNVATHADIEDDEQTVHFPDLHTTASDKVDGDHEMLADEKAVVVDTVEYKNLIPGKEYTMKGVLMDKKTGGEILSDGKTVTAETKFTPEEPDGTVTLEFELNASDLKGQTIVVFEDVYDEDVKVGTHSDIEDKDQSIFIPEIRTTATDKADGDHRVTAGGKVTITDTVTYKNLTPGEKYKMSGTLMDKSTGKAFLVNGKEVTAETEFTPKEADGTVTLDFTFDASAIKKQTDVVVFEKLFNVKTGAETAKHEDINDADQTVTIVMPPKTVKTGDNMNMYTGIGCGIVLLLGAAVLLFRRKRQ